jgi:hypothetical protein
VNTLEAPNNAMNADLGDATRPSAGYGGRSASVPFCTLTPLHRWQYRRL